METNQDTQKQKPAPAKVKNFRRRPGIFNRSLSIDDLRGEHDFIDSRGRRWAIRVFTIGNINQFYDAAIDLYYKMKHYEADSALLSVLLSSCAPFYQKCLRNPRPTWKTLLRRVRGLDDFTIKEIQAGLVPVDTKPLVEKIMRVNIDETLEAFVKGIEAAQKKMIPTPVKEPTGQGS